MEYTAYQNDHGDVVAKRTPVDEEVFEVLFDFNPNRPDHVVNTYGDEITLKEKERVMMVKDYGDDWVKVTKEDGEQGVCHRDYLVGDSEEIDLKIGKRYYIIKELTDEWTVVEEQDTAKRGLVPSDRLNIVPKVWTGEAEDELCEKEDTQTNKIKSLSELLTDGVMKDTWENSWTKFTYAEKTGSRKLNLYSNLKADSPTKVAIDSILDQLWRTGVQTIIHRCGVNTNKLFPFPETEKEWLQKIDELYIMTRHHFHPGRGGGTKYYLYSNNFKDVEGYLYKLSFGHYPHYRGTAKRAKMQYIKKPTN